jgi:hypothetical protein
VSMSVAVTRSCSSRDQRCRSAAKRALLLIGLTLAGLTLGEPWSFAQDSEGKVAAPPKEESVARKVVVGIYVAAVSNANTAAQRSGLARAVFSDSAVAKTDAERSAMLALAISLAEQGDDGMLVLEVLDHGTSIFSVDASELLADVLPRTSADPKPDDWAAWSKAVPAAFTASLLASRFNDAEKLLAAFSNRTRKFRHLKAQSSTAAMTKRLVILRKQGNVLAELQDAATAPSATAKEAGRLGKQLYFVGNNWEAGLQYLARGDCPQRAAAARRELEKSRGFEPGPRRRGMGAGGIEPSVSEAGSRLQSCYRPVSLRSSHA